ncbi:uncharacterized protein LOC117780235 [Drosophila innubila]|uniref:uncharacterized protein LOC117780235 n=1 Tax=Drosophila innubila TaxID=198719 RepID=UPI00148BDF72|nr:uncharacterized protein LOC117780235 [Drosophila innubila]
MPPKRKTQLQFNTKTQIPNRVQRTNITSAAPNVCVKSNHGSEMENSIPNEMAPLVKIPSSSNQFAVPQFNTIVRKHGEATALQNMRVAVAPDLTPRSKAAIAPNVTKKMNFAPNAAVFKNLTPLNVNDSLYEMNKTKAASSKSKESIQKCHQAEPTLEEFVEKIDHFRLIMPEPELQLDFPREDFDFLVAYKKVYGYD